MLIKGSKKAKSGRCGHKDCKILQKLLLDVFKRGIFLVNCKGEVLNSKHKFE